ncbi:unnamed protein product [Prunus armeniaca]
MKRPATKKKKKAERRTTAGKKRRRNENSRRTEKLASTLQKGKSHFKGQESLKETALLKYFRGYDLHPVCLINPQRFLAMMISIIINNVKNLSKAWLRSNNSSSLFDQSTEILGYDDFNHHKQS